MQDSTQDQLFQLQQTIKKKRERKEKACLGRNLLVQGKESHIKLPFPPLPLLASHRIHSPSSDIGSFIKIFWV